MAENNTVYKLEQLTFGWMDYSLFSALLGISVLIGIYFGFVKKQDNTTDYLLGGKTMSYFPVAMSLVASHISGITLLGIPSEVYAYGTQYAAFIVTCALTCLVTAVIYLPVFFKLQLTSTFAYLELRFSKTVRLLASFLYTLALLGHTPLVVYVPALAFAQATGISITYITPVICTICIFYTTIGGLKAVVWTDTIQLIVTLGSLFTVFILGANSVGGFSEIFRVSEEGGRLIFFNMDPSPYLRNSFWGMSIGMTVTWCAWLGVGQGSVQRFLAVPTQRDVLKSIGVMAVGITVIKVISIVTGLIIYTKYHGCDPVKAQVIEKTDQVLPYYVMDVAGHIPGLPGLFLAGLVSAGLSTMSAGLNTMAGTIYEDFIEPWVPDNVQKESKGATIMKIIVVILGAISLMLVFLVAQLGEIFQVSLSVNGISMGTMVGLFSLGMLTPWATAKGALYGGCLSLALMAWIVIGAQYYILKKALHYDPLPVSTEDCADSEYGSAFVPTNNSVTAQPEPQDEPFFLYRLSFMYYALIGTFSVMIFGLIASAICGFNDLSEVNPDLFPPIIHRFLPKKKYMEVPLKPIPPISDPEKQELNSH